MGTRIADVQSTADLIVRELNRVDVNHDGVASTSEMSDLDVCVREHLPSILEDSGSDGFEIAKVRRSLDGQIKSIRATDRDGDGVIPGLAPLASLKLPFETRALFIASRTFFPPMEHMPPAERERLFGDTPLADSVVVGTLTMPNVAPNFDEPAFAAASLSAFGRGLRVDSAVPSSLAALTEALSATRPGDPAIAAITEYARANSGRTGMCYAARYTEPDSGLLFVVRKGEIATVIRIPNAR